MLSKGSSYTLNCSVPGRGISVLLLGWLFPFSISCFISTFFVVVFCCFLRPCARNLVIIFAHTNSLGKGKASRCTPKPLALHGSKRIAHATPQDVIFGDPSSFVAGELSRHQSYWKFILSEHPTKDEILSYIIHGVNISDFFVPFKDDF